MEYCVIIILGRFSQVFKHEAACTLDMLEIPRVAGETAPMPRVVLPLPPPEIRGVGGKRAGMVDPCDRVLPADQECRTSCSCSILERIARSALGHIGADGKTVFDHIALRKTHTGLDTGSPCLAGKFVVCRHHSRGCPDGFAHRACRWFHRIGMRFTSHIDCPDLLRVDIPPQTAHSLLPRPR